MCLIRGVFPMSLEGRQQLTSIENFPLYLCKSALGGPRCRSTNETVVDTALHLPWPFLFQWYQKLL